MSLGARVCGPLLLVAGAAFVIGFVAKVDGLVVTSLIVALLSSGVWLAAQQENERRLPGR